MSGSVKFPNRGEKSTGAAGDGAIGDGAASGDGASIERVFITQKYELKFAVDPAFMEKLERVRSMFSSKYHRKRSFEELFDLMMDEYLERHAPEGRIARRKKRAGNKKSEPRLKERKERDVAKHPNRRDDRDRRSRHIPQSTRDEVFARDGERCTFTDPDGVRCNSTRNLEIDHIIPYARGGSNAAHNLRLLCARHTILEAERAYGLDFMNRYT